MWTIFSMLFNVKNEKSRYFKVMTAFICYLLVVWIVPRIVFCFSLTEMFRFPSLNCLSFIHFNSSSPFHWFNILNVFLSRAVICRMYSCLNYEKMFLILVSLRTTGTWNINQGVLITYRTALLVVCQRNRNCCLWLQFSSLHAVTMENWNQSLLCTLNDCRGFLNPSKNYFHIQTSLQIKLNPFDIFFCNFFLLVFCFCFCIM